MRNKIKLYKSSDCLKCSAAKFIIQRILISKGFSYNDFVEEKDVKMDRDAMADLLMYDTINIPLIIIGNRILKDEDVTKEQLIKEAIEEWLKNLN
ncbi:MAG: hypothetical protein NZ922_02315 [Candidatus Methanomethyliaceae archaeon]|nr:hypothetical protein [Candidatus Methanomethyliaceae archaeon]MDW7971001.1 hypothetical protein [Nitrososphaerota archaeon]